MIANSENLSELPKSWAWAEISEIGDIAAGGTPSTKDDSNFGGDVPWLTPADLSDFKAKYIKRGKRNLSKKGLNSSSAVLLPTETVLFTSRAPVGYVAIATNPIATNQGFKNLTPAKGIFSEYVFYYLKGSKKLAESYASGTTFLELSASRFARVPIPIPPAPEQKRIVAKIEELFTKLDAGVEALKKVRQELKRYRQAVLKHAFEGKLTGEKKEWNVRKIKDVIELIDGDRGRNYPKRGDYLESGHCLFLSTKNVRPNGFLFDDCVFISEEKHKQLRKGTLERGDIVLTTRGTIGNVAYYDSSVSYGVIRINSGMLILRISSEVLNPTFLTYYIQSPLFELQIMDKRSGTAQPQLPAGVLKDFVIPVPPSLEQEQIVSEIERHFSIADQIEQTIEQGLKQSERLRQSVLKQAFEGKLVPQDPEDEPAEKLLERIKAEKVKLQARKCSGQTKRKGKRKSIVRY